MVLKNDRCPKLFSSLMVSFDFLRWHAWRQKSAKFSKFFQSMILNFKLEKSEKCNISHIIIILRVWVWPCLSSHKIHFLCQFINRLILTNKFKYVSYWLLSSISIYSFLFYNFNFFLPFSKIEKVTFFETLKNVFYIFSDISILVRWVQIEL